MKLLSKYSVVVFLLNFICGIIFCEFMNFRLEFTVYQIAFGFVVVLGLLAILKNKNVGLFYLITCFFVLSLGYLSHQEKVNKKYTLEKFQNQVKACKGIVYEHKKLKNGILCKLRVFGVYDRIFSNIQFDVNAFFDSRSKVKMNDTVYFKSLIVSSKFHNNPGEVDYNSYNLHKNNIGIVFLDSKNSVIKKGVESYFSSSYITSRLESKLSEELSGEELSVAKAFLWGDRDGLSNELTDSFANTGTIHILAVSGLHVGILVLLIVLVAKTFFSRLLKKKHAVLFSIVVIWLYAYITGFSPSILRSVIVFTFLFYTDVIEKQVNNLVLLSLSGFILLLINTEYLFDLGFQLTYSALIGIYIFYPILQNFITVKNKYLKYWYDPTILCISAQITTLPIVLYHFHQFPNYFLIANFLLIPFSVLILALGITFFLFSWIYYLKILIGKMLAFVIFLMNYIVTSASQLKFSTAKQFDLGVFSILMIFMSIILVFYSLSKQNNRSFSMLSFFICVITIGIIQFNRYKKLDSKFIGKLGGCRTAVICKNNNSIRIIYDRSETKKIQKKISGLKRYFGLNIKTMELDYQRIISLNLDGKEVSTKKLSKYSNSFIIM